jgi:hypothetical protein
MLKWLLFLCCVPTAAQSQRILTGIVLDANTQLPLVGAVLKINAVQGVVTDDGGRFFFPNVSVERGFLLGSYLGYGTDSVFFDFKNQNTLQRTVRLKPVDLLLETVNVRGELQGQNRALSDQRTASNIKNVVDAEQMRKFPDMNAAEAIARLPGITLQRDQGEGRYVGRADDVVGQASGRTRGNAFNWSYTLALPVDGRVWHVQFDDWMYLMSDRVMLNKASMSKFGIFLGEVTLSFTKRV